MNSALTNIYASRAIPMTRSFKEILIIVLTSAALTAFLQEDECNYLSDGRYKIKYRTKGYEKENFELIINGPNYTIIDNSGQSRSGRINWLDECSFSLGIDSMATPSLADTLKWTDNDPKSIAAKTKRHLDRSTDLSFLLSGGITYYEFDKVSRRKYHFRLTSTARPHITMAEGKLVRLGN